MIKKYTIFLIALLCALNAVAQRFESDGINYIITSDSKKTVQVLSGGNYSGDIVIPSQVIYEGKYYDVTSIGNTAFCNCRNLTSVVIPDGVISIGSNAFNNSGITTIDIPSTVTSIDFYAFYKCSNLTSITIPKSVTSIGSCAFSACSSLSSIIVAAGNTVYDSRNGCNAIVNTITNALVVGCKNTVIPEDISYIYSDAFLNCIGLTSITIPESVISISGSAFSGCSSLTSITIPKSVTRIDYSAFSACSSLASIIVAAGNTVYDSRNDCNAIVETATNTLVVGCVNTVIPPDVTSIGRSAFSSCSNLTSITIPESVTNIISSAFSGCNSLSSIIVAAGNTVYDSRHGCNAIVETATNTLIVGCVNTEIPPDVTSIGEGAFSDCSNLTSITISENVTSIGSSAFSGCSSLTSITIPKSVTSIASSAFSACSSLTSIIVAADNTVYDSRHGCNAIVETSTNTLVVGCVNTVIPPDVTSIGNGAFSDCSNLTSITITKGVTSIGGGAFSNCGNLTSVIIPEGVTSIGWGAFSSCVCLTSITIPEGVTCIRGSTFYFCFGLTSVTIPESVTIIDNDAFHYCCALTSITIPEDVTQIGNYAFSGCIGLTTITIPESVTSIGSSAFSGCIGLRSISIPKNATSIGESPLSGCSGLTSITVEEGNSVYDSRNGCNALIKTTRNRLISGCNNTWIPEGITSIGRFAFSGCQELSSITIPEGVTSIGYYAFDGCSNLKAVTVYSSLIEECSYVFDDVSKLKIYVLRDQVDMFKNGCMSEYSDIIECIPDLYTNEAGDGSGRWCTYYNGYADIRVPDDVTIYKAAVNDRGSVTLTEIPGHIIKKGEAVLLNTTNNNIELYSETWDGEASIYAGNELKGVDVSTPQSIGTTNYVLSKVDDKFGFYRLQEDIPLGAGRAYLAVDNRNLTQLRSFYGVGFYNEGSETDVTILRDETEIAEWFTIYGEKLNGAPVESGLYICNGNKVYIK